MLSVIIPVYNEQETVNQTITRVKSNYPDNLQIIVSDGNPNFSTLSSIQDKSVIKVKSKPGRGNGLIDGAKKATGDTLVFLHSDTILPKNGLELIEKTLKKPEIAGGAFDLAIDSPKLIFRIIEKTASIRSRLSRIPYGDQTIFVRKNIYDKLGGFNPLPIMEDVDFMKKLKKSGHKIQIIEKAVKTSPRRWQKEGIIYTTLRNWLLISLYNFGVSPNKLASLYKRNK